MPQEDNYYGLSVEEFRKRYARMMTISRETLGEFRANTLLKRVGYTDEEMALPKIAIYNSWGEQSPGHMVFKNIARAVRTGANLAGAMVVESGIGGPGDCLGHVQLPNREAILSEIEAGFFQYADGWIGLCSCDKQVPPFLMAALRMEKPCIIVTGGTAIPTKYEGQTMMVGHCEQDAGGLYPLYLRGEITDQELATKLKIVSDYVGFCSGTCEELTTGSSMQIATEAMGMCLPGSAMIPSVVSERIRSSKRAGMQIVNLIKQGIKASDIITTDAVRNAIAVLTAVGGGTNAFIHIQALAYEGDLKITPNDWSEIQKRVPVLANIAPSDTRPIPNTLYDFYLAGGVPAVMREIQDQLHLDCLTVTGKTLGENLQAFPSTRNVQVVRSRSNPFWAEGSMVILKGSLAPVCAVMRHTIVKHRDLLTHDFPAVVFNSDEEAIQGITTGDPKPVEDGQAIVVKYHGARARLMKSIWWVTNAARRSGLFHCCVVSDGRTSGFTRDLVVIVNIVPEAYVGGPLAIVEDGDIIQLNMPERRIDLDLPKDDIQERLAKWKQPKPRSGMTKGVAKIYSLIANQADQGAGWPSRGTRPVTPKS